MSVTPGSGSPGWTKVTPVGPGGFYGVPAVCMQVRQPAVVQRFNFFVSLSAARQRETKAVKNFVTIIQRRHIGVLCAKRFTNLSAAGGGSLAHDLEMEAEKMEVFTALTAPSQTHANFTGVNLLLSHARVIRAAQHIKQETWLMLPTSFIEASSWKTTESQQMPVTSSVCFKHELGNNRVVQSGEAQPDINPHTSEFCGKTKCKQK